MGTCLRGKLADAGILPQPAVVAAKQEAASAAVAAAKPDVAIAEPELDITPPAATAAPKAPDDLIAATFGLLRAEPDGSMVITGSGAPGSEIEVYADDQLLGKAKVEPSGDWVLVPDAPIPPGGTELTLAEAGKTGRAAESFVVVINEDKTSEPLLVASTPGQASEVLQGLERPAAGTTTEVAAADPQQSTPAVAAPAPAEPAATEPAAAEVAPADPTTAEPATPGAVVTGTPEASAPDNAASLAEAVEASAAAASVTDTPATVTAPAAVAAAASEPQSASTDTAPEPVAAAVATDLAVANPEPVVPTPAKPAPTPAVAAVPPTIDAIEIEGDKTFFAGAGSDGAVVRLYIDGKYIADATVDGGRWLVEAGNVLTQPNQRIRVDMLKPNSAEVAARAEVDFEVQLPAEKPTQVAEAQPTPAEPTPSPAVATKPAAADAVTAPPKPADEQTAIVEAPVKAAEPAATAIAKAAEPVTSQLPPVPEADQPALAETATPAAEPAPVPDAPVAATVDSPTPAAETAEPQVPTAAGDVPTMVAVAVGDPEAARFASGKAIIRRGDNLWTIARRVYGAGIKYTTIYEANTGQIRDPDWIYPGQVFDLPKSAE
ncbi:MAG TPA: LysM peptidoglycan-binding domain-containing protein [Devosia sp.]|nr:LysM peptidoglycan-binding domain-containing protein [Devosia sp.]